MSRSRVSRRALSGAMSLLVAAGVLAAAPAQSDPSGPYSSWTHREDAASGPGTTYAWSGPDAALGAEGANGGLMSVYADEGSGWPWPVWAAFLAPEGQALQAGVTYRAEATPMFDWSTSATARMAVWRDGTMCGKTSAELFPNFENPTPAVGWFRIHELERDGDGNPTRFSVTYELNCQYLGGQPGLEGSIAINATAPAAAVPPVPAAPRPVTDLTSANVYPNRYGFNTTTLTWQNPVGFGDVVLDAVQSEHASKLPAMVGGTSLNFDVYRGRASTWRDTHVDFMDTRTYRLVPRSTYGRLGPASVLTIIATRVNISEPTDRIMVGQQVRFSGRLTLSWDWMDVPGGSTMEGPGLAGRVVQLCSQTLGDWRNACVEVGRTRTTTGGRFTLVATPKENTYYEVMVPATPRMVGNTSLASSRIYAMVAPYTDLTAPGAVEGLGRVAAGPASKVIRFSTSAARRGSRGVVLLQRFDGHKWRTVARRSLDGKGRRLTIPYTERGHGAHSYRVVKPGDKKHVTGYSRTVRVTVR